MKESETIWGYFVDGPHAGQTHRVSVESVRMRRWIGMPHPLKPQIPTWPPNMGTSEEWEQAIYYVHAPSYQTTVVLSLRPPPPPPPGQTYINAFEAELYAASRINAQFIAILRIPVTESEVRAEEQRQAKLPPPKLPKRLRRPPNFREQ